MIRKTIFLLTNDLRTKQSMPMKRTKDCIDAINCITAWNTKGKAFLTKCLSALRKRWVSFT